jgi:hypothetical protein
VDIDREDAGVSHGTNPKIPHETGENEAEIGTTA